jgi:hypothetical protein
MYMCIMMLWCLRPARRLERCEATTLGLNACLCAIVVLD